MQTIDDISYGVIPLIQADGVWKVFLINQYGRTGDVYWTFPKGHPEGEESGEQTALRELTEEARITLESLDTTKIYEQAYSFPCDGVMVNKKVVYYLGIAASQTYTVQEDEVKEAGWYTFDIAVSQLTHERAKVMLAQVFSDIQAGN